MALPMFHIDAFTNQPFHGNPAAVCPLAKWLDDETLQAVALENNLSETAYFVAENENYRLRWFTPKYEANLCGHATLASAFVLMTILEPQRGVVRFMTRSGMLTVRREPDFFAMDFPALPPWICATPPAGLKEGLPGPSPVSVQQIKDDYFVIYESEQDVRQLAPNLALLESLHPAGVAITAPGTHADFVSRYFAPSYGIPEDPVTGSTHCSLVPYWAKRLGKAKLHAQQVSQRGGDLWCELLGERVRIKGNARLTLEGSLLI